MKTILVTFLVLIMPALGALGHDFYLYYTADPDLERPFYLADIGWIWVTYHEQSHSTVNGNSAFGVAENNFNNKTSALVVHFGVWDLYKDTNYQNHILTVREDGGPYDNGVYPNLKKYNADNCISSVRIRKKPSKPVVKYLSPEEKGIILYEHINLEGDQESFYSQSFDLGKHGGRGKMDNRASSAKVNWGIWVLYAAAGFDDSIEILSNKSGQDQNGRIRTFRERWMNDEFSSLRIIKY